MILCPHCNATVAYPSCNFRAGDSLGPFEIISLIGKGGMGNVYLAKQKSMGRLVALKTISSSLLNDSKTREQFANEVQISARLNHPNIVTAIDAGEDKGVYYLAVNFIDGEDYDKRLHREFSISEKEALYVALAVADALKYAWDKHRLIHKDIKPANIMKDKRGGIFLMDLGIAHKVGKFTGVAKDVVLGSPFYMSPEQAQANDEIDFRTDIYSLGATLYHMIVGVPPFEAPDAQQTLQMHVETPFPAPESRNPNSKISYHTVNLIKKMMQKKPAERFASWDEFKEAAKKVQVLLEASPTGTVDKCGETSAKSPTGTTRSKTNSWSKTTAVAQKDLKGQSTKTSMQNKVQTQASIAKKTSASMLLVNYGIIIVTAIIIAFIAKSYLKNSSASKSLHYADQYAEKYPYNYEEVKRQYYIALQKSKGTSYETEAFQKYNSALAREENYKKEKEIYEEKMKEVFALVAANKHKQAIAILEDLKKINDPTLREYVLGTIISVENDMKTKGFK